MKNKNDQDIDILFHEIFTRDKEPEPYINQRILQQWNQKHKKYEKRNYKSMIAVGMTGILAILITAMITTKYFAEQKIIENKKEVVQPIFNIEKKEEIEDKKSVQKRKEERQEKKEKIPTRAADAGYLADKYSAEDILERAVFVEGSEQVLEKESDGLYYYTFSDNEDDKIRYSFQADEVFEKKVGYSKIIEWIQDSDNYYRDYILCYRDKDGIITGYVYRETIDSLSLP